MNKDFNVLFEHYRQWNAKMRAGVETVPSLTDYLTEQGYTIPAHLRGLPPVRLLNELAQHWGLTGRPA